MTRAMLMGRAVEIFLKRNGLETQVQTALVFVSAHMFVESIRPAVRVILSDAVEKFVVSFAQNQPVLDPDGVRRAADLLTNPVTAAASSPADLRQELAPQELDWKSCKSRSHNERCVHFISTGRLAHRATDRIRAPRCWADSLVGPRHRSECAMGSHNRG